MTQHRHSHPYEVGDLVTITLEVTGRIDSDGDLSFSYSNQDLDDYNLNASGVEGRYIAGQISNGSYIVGSILDSCPDAFRPYGTPATPPITDDDLKDALASIINRT